MADKEESLELGSMTLGDHLDELRSRILLALLGLVAGLIICAIFGDLLFKVLMWPYEKGMTAAGLEPQMRTIKIQEKFTVYFNTALLFGLILSSPWLFYQLWKFIALGLYPSEKRYVYVVAPASAVLFAGGAVFFLMVVAPLMVRFFASFNLGIQYVVTDTTVQAYTSMVITLALVFGLAFQLPIAVVAANRLGLVKLKTLHSIRKYVIVVIVILSAVITPPDVVSQIALSIPLYFLYELSVWTCSLLDRLKNRKKEN